MVNPPREALRLSVVLPTLHQRHQSKISCRPLGVTVRFCLLGEKEMIVEKIKTTAVDIPQLAE